MRLQKPGTIARADLWIGGTGGYHTYRIPALAVSPRGTLLAFCEGRRHSRSDWGEIDLLLRRSPNGGHTWQEPQVVVTEPGMTCGNPAPVVDGQTGTIWLLCCKNPAQGGEALIRKGLAERTVWLTCSIDDGATWAPPVEITAAVKRPEWTWYATGPCHGIQLRSGRLLVPCDHRVRPTSTSPEARHSHVIFSDDHGATWRIGGIVAQEGTNECAAVETASGAVYLSCRDQGRRGRRCAAWSFDGGETFPEYRWEEALIDPACQGSLAALVIVDPGRQQRTTCLLHCNPASATRDTLTVRLGDGEGRAWYRGRVLEAGPAAYSDLAVATEQPGEPALWCLYERGSQSPYERLTLARFDLPWLQGAEDNV